MTGETARTFETGNDQLFRELIAEFSADFVRLVMPDVARRIELAALEFKRCEYFSDSPRGGVSATKTALQIESLQELAQMVERATVVESPDELMLREEAA